MTPSDSVGILPGRFLAFGGGGGGGNSGSLVFWLVMALVIIIIAATAFKWSRRASFGGKGPAINWFPGFMRPWVNKVWRRMGWPEPYDANFDKIPRAER